MDSRLAFTLALFTAVLGVGAVAGAATNNISTVAGTGAAGYNGEGLAAGSSQLNVPVSVDATADGGYLIGDQGNERVRRVSPSGVMTTVAGNGTNGPGGDGGPATLAQLSTINGVAETADGGFLIADSNNHRVRRVAPDGTISTVAGTGGFGYNGDDIPATQALLNFPISVAPTADGGFLIADNDNHRIRKVLPGGNITTVAGLGSPGYNGDGVAAPRAQLNDPTGVVTTPDGGFLIADLLNHRVRRVAPDGTISTVAGTGSPGFSGDGGAATTAQLNNPIAVATTPDGGFVITDRGNNRIRRVSPGGTITTVAGDGTAGFGGDGGLATSGQLNQPVGLDVTAEGDYLIADTINHRVRFVDAGDPLALGLGPPVLGETVNVARIRGVVRVAIAQRNVGAGSARAAQKGLRFVPLTAVRQIPVGSFLDTRRGTVQLVTATTRPGRTQAGQFSAGVFQVLQSRRRSARGLTSLRLKGSSFNRCRRSGKRAVTSQRRLVRRLRANARGRFRTRGRHSAATVRGTIWITADRCDGTLTTVRRGRVAVRDFRRKRTILVRAGKRYLARAR